MNLKYKNKLIQKEIQIDKNRSIILINNTEYQVRKIDSGIYAVTNGNNSYIVNLTENKNKIYSQIFSENFTFELQNENDFFINTNLESQESVETIYAPMPGNVLKVMIKEGDKVEEGQSLLIIEAMKMENTIYAPHTGKIVKLNALENSQVDIDNPILIIEKE